MNNIPDFIYIAIGWVVMILGLSFAYKCYRAGIEGRMSYWHGFLPLTVISPFLVHVPVKEGTLIKETTGLWVHTVMAPVFFIISILCLSMGADFAGLPGTDTLNLILGGGNPTAPPIIVYDKNRNFSFKFPIFTRLSNRFTHTVNSYHIPLRENQKLPTYPSSQDPKQEQ